MNKDRVYERKIKGITYYVAETRDSSGKNYFMVYEEIKGYMVGDKPIAFKNTEEEAIKYLREYEV